MTTSRRPRTATRYLSAPTLVRLVQTLGVEACLRGIAEHIREAFSELRTATQS